MSVYNSRTIDVDGTLPAEAGARLSPEALIINQRNRLLLWEIAAPAFLPLPEDDWLRGAFTGFETPRV